MPSSADLTRLQLAPMIPLRAQFYCDAVPYGWANVSGVDQRDNCQRQPHKTGQADCAYAKFAICRGCDFYLRQHDFSSPSQICNSLTERTDRLGQDQTVQCYCLRNCGPLTRARRVNSGTPITYASIAIKTLFRPRKHCAFQIYPYGCQGVPLVNMSSNIGYDSQFVIST